MSKSTRETLTQFARSFLSAQGLAVHPLGSDAENPTALIFVIGDKIMTVQVIESSDTLQSDVTSVSYNLSRAEEKLGERSLRLEIENVFLVAFVPDRQSIKTIEELRHDFTYGKRRFVILDNYVGNSLEEKVRHALERSIVQVSPPPLTSLESPMERLEDLFPDKTDKFLLRAYKDGGDERLREAIAKSV